MREKIQKAKPSHFNAWNDSSASFAIVHLSNNSQNSQKPRRHWNIRLQHVLGFSNDDLVYFNIVTCFEF